METYSYYTRTAEMELRILGMESVHNLKKTPKIEEKSKTSARSSSSSSSINSKSLQTKFNSTRRISSDNQSQKSTTRNEINDQG